MPLCRLFLSLFVFEIWKSLVSRAEFAIICKSIYWQFALVETGRRTVVLAECNRYLEDTCHPIPKSI